MLTLLRALGRAVGFCSHRDAVRERINGVWYFVCDCGYRVPMLQRRPRLTFK